MQFHLANILVFVGLGLAFLFAILLAGRIFRPQTPDPDKLTSYECGERPFSQAWFNFNPRFYIIAIAFLVFDVEVAFMYPVATVLRHWVASGAGWFAFGEIAVFVAVLALALAYIWRKGDLEWVRPARSDDKSTAAVVPGPGPAAPPATRTDEKAV